MVSIHMPIREGGKWDVKLVHGSPSTGRLLKVTVMDSKASPSTTTLGMTISERRTPGMFYVWATAFSIDLAEPVKRLTA